MRHSAMGWACRTILILVIGLTAITEGRVSAAGLTLTGVTEGGTVLLPGPLPTTNLSVAASGSGGNVLFILEHQGAIRQRITSSPPNAVTFSNLGPGKYFLAAHTVSNAAVSTDASFDLQPMLLRPPNDSWSQATLISNGETPAYGTNLTATSEPGEPFHANNGGGRSLWWKWRASSNAVVTVSTAGSTFDTVLGIYMGTGISNLTLVAENDDAGTNRVSQATFTAAAGITYFIAVDAALPPGGGTLGGTVALQIIAGTPPSITVSFPTNGFSTLVGTAGEKATVPLNATVVDSVGLAHVCYALDGAAISREEIFPPPYRDVLSGLPVGDYWLTVTAVNALGLTASAHTSFSVGHRSAAIAFLDGAPGAAEELSLGVTGLKGAAYELQSSTNVTVWAPLIRWTNFDGAQRFVDTNAWRFSAQFYRVLAP